MRKIVVLKIVLPLGCLAALLIAGRFVFGKSEAYTALSEAFEATAAAARTSSRHMVKEIKKFALAYPNITATMYDERASVIVAETDTLLAMLDAMQQDLDATLIRDFEKRLDTHRYFLTKTAHLGQDSTFNLPEFDSNLKHENLGFRNTTLSAWKASLAILERDFLENIIMKYSSNGFFNCSRLRLIYNFSPINPAPSDTVEGHMFLTCFRWRFEPNFFVLNGDTAHLIEGIAPFDLRFDRPGIHPLHLQAEVRDREGDSVFVVEKTYQIRVR